MMLMKIQKEIKGLTTESSGGPRYCSAAQQKVLNTYFYLLVLQNPFLQSSLLLAVPFCFPRSFSCSSSEVY